MNFKTEKYYEKTINIYGTGFNAGPVIFLF
jgi:hypothetical protein